jgi:hypothetical protein
MIETIKAFASAFASTVVGLLSGIASLVMAGIAAETGDPHSRWWWAASYICGALAAFLIWQAEWTKPGPKIRVKYETEHTKQPGEMTFSEYKEMADANERAGKSMLKVPIILENLSEVPAMEVKIRDVVRGEHTAKFYPIPKVEKGQPLTVSPTIETFGTLQCRDFDHFLRKDLTTLEDQRIPLFVHCQDFDCKEFYETEFEIRYNLWVFSTHIVRHRRINKPSPLLRRVRAALRALRGLAD